MAFFTCSVIVLLISYFYEADWLLYVKVVFTTGLGGIPLWFVPVLFFSRLVLFFICDKRNLSRMILGIVLCMLLAAFLSQNAIRISYNLSSVCFASVFLILGFMSRNIIVLLENMRSIKLIFIAVALWLVGFIISYFRRLDMCDNTVLPIIPLTIGAICGTLVIIIVSILLQKENIKISFLQKRNCLF